MNEVFDQSVRFLQLASETVRNDLPRTQRMDLFDYRTHCICDPTD